MKSVASGEWRVASGETATLHDALLQATKEFAATSPSPRIDAEALLQHVCGLDRAGLIAHGAQPLSTAQRQELRELLARRKHGEPVAYLVGAREFWSLDLKVAPATLIPRPETELLVEQALAHIPADAGWTVADLGTGSGAIALALAQERPRCHIIATDISAAALGLARENAARLGIANVEFRAGDWFAPLAGMRFELIVSNPPYVRAGDPHLGRGDVRFEPRAALAAGPDGLDAIRRIAAAAAGHLTPGGRLLLEHGHDQGRAVGVLLEHAGLRDIVRHHDLAGRERVTEGRLPAA